MSGRAAGRPGIRVRKGGTVTIKGTGKIVAEGNGDAAGIGTGSSEIYAGGNIVIEGTPTITATAGYGGAAGIGGGKEKGCDNITIHGGTITAQGGENGFTFTIVASDNVDGTGNATSYELILNNSETVIDETGKAARFFRLRALQAE